MRPRDIVLMLLVNTFWAFNFIASKYGVEHFPPIFFTALRFALLFVLLLPFLKPVPRDQWKAVLGIALTMGILHFSLMFTGLGLAADISSVAIASQLHVPFATLLAVLVLGERIRWRRILGIAAAFLGVMVIGFDPVVFSHIDALALVTASAVAMAMNSVIAATVRNVNAFTLQAWMALIATPGLTLVSLVTETGHWHAIAAAGWWEWGAVVYSCVGASVIGHGIVYTLLTRYPVSVTAPYLLLTPVLAVGFGVILWGDHLSWKLLFGGLLTLGGVAIITIRAPKFTAAAAKAGELT